MTKSPSMQKPVIEISISPWIVITTPIQKQICKVNLKFGIFKRSSMYKQIPSVNFFSRCVIQENIIARNGNSWKGASQIILFWTTISSIFYARVAWPKILDTTEFNDVAIKAAVRMVETLQPWWWVKHRSCIVLWGLCLLENILNDAFMFTSSLSWIYIMTK